MVFLTRAVIEENDLYRRRIWKSRDGRFRVSEFRRKLEAGRKVFKAEYLSCIGPDVWDVISHHKTRQAAERACVQYLQKESHAHTYAR